MIKTRTLDLYEVFALLNAATTDGDRISILAENQGFVLNTVLQANFDPAIQFALPSGTPPYEVDNGDSDSSMNRISTVIRDLPLLLIGDNSLDSLKKEMRFIGMLESSNEENAKILIAMKDKKLCDICPSLSVTLVRQAIFGITY